MEPSKKIKANPGAVDTHRAGCENRNPCGPISISCTQSPRNAESESPESSADWQEQIIGNSSRCLRFFVCKPHYLCYIDPEYKIHLDSDEVFDNQMAGWTQAERKRYFEVYCKITQIESGSYSNLDDKEMSNFKEQLATALDCNIEKEPEAAEKLAQVAEQYAASRCEKNSKTLYRKYGMVSLVICLLCALLFALGNMFFDYGEALWQLGLGALAGGAGAWLSIALRVGKMKPDSRATDRMYRWEVATKVAAGIVSALFITMCFKSKLILGTLQIEPENRIYAVVIIGFIGGFSERFAPSIIGKLAREETSGETASPSPCKNSIGGE